MSPFVKQANKWTKKKDGGEEGMRTIGLTWAAGLADDREREAAE